MTTLYGIPNCDQIKKAKQWLEQHHIDYHFHDYRKDGLPTDLNQWLEQSGWQTIVNRRSTSWKAIPESERNNMNNASALKHISASPTLVKRPLLTTGSTILVGFDQAKWQATLLDTPTKKG